MMDDLKKLVSDAMIEAKEIQESQGEICQIKSFFKWRWTTPHKWKKWEDVGEGRHPQKGLVTKILERKCKNCGLKQSQSIKFG